MFDGCLYAVVRSYLKHALPPFVAYTFIKMSAMSLQSPQPVRSGGSGSFSDDSQLVQDQAQRSRGSFPCRHRCFDQDITLEELLGPSNSDSEKLEMIRDMYGIGNGDEPTQWYTKGEKSFITHELNDRRHELWDKELSGSMLDRGIVDHVSGAPWGQYSSGNVLPLRMISWGSRCRAFYMAVESHADHHVVKRELQKGLVVHRFHDRMPPCVVNYMVNFHNTFHRGAGVSFLEVQSKVLDYESQWRAHCRNTGQTVRSIGTDRYESAMAQFVLKTSNGVLDDGEQYNRAKAKSVCQSCSQAMHGFL